MALDRSTGPLPAYDLVVVGATPAGLSLAAEAAEAGLGRVIILETRDRIPIPDAVTHHRLDLRYVDRIDGITRTPDGTIAVTAPDVITFGRTCVIADVGTGTTVPPDFDLPPDLDDRVHFELGEWVTGDDDVLVVGRGETSVEFTEHLVAAGCGVVLCFPRRLRDTLSPLSRSRLQHHESQRRLTILWQSMPDEVAAVEGYPMAFFSDRSTPDLQVDHVVFALGSELDPAGVSALLQVSDISGIYVLTDAATTWQRPPEFAILEAAAAWTTLARRHFPDHLAPVPQRRPGENELRAQFYNATITRFDRTHGELWILRVAPDGGEVSHHPGQYATLGLGYWEPRIDDVADPRSVSKRDQLIRRSYSISSPIFDDDGYLAPAGGDELEFYIVRVPPGGSRIPALTPRLATRAAGDRIYLGPRIAGRYTLHPLRDPDAAVLFVSTGTGEAPHNSMITELLRKGHQGPVLSVVTVRNTSDLGYLETHRELERRFGNYHYRPIVTRDPAIERKRYVQDLLADGDLEELLGAPLDPDSSHVFLCGNPAMIGPPEWDGDTPRFPGRRGMAQTLHERGFSLTRRSKIGNVHYEEYW